VILGEFRDGLPRVTLTLAGEDGSPVAIEFILDIAFDGDLKLPANLLRRLQAGDMGQDTRMLADGSLVECSIHEVTLFWNGEPRLMEALVLHGNPGDGRLQTEDDLAREEAGPDSLFAAEEVLMVRPWKSLRSVSPRKAPPTSSGG
jgi:predicted aspartyl protease